MRVYYDLHLHSCLSPCADADMTPRNIVNMAALAGCGVIAVSDHNSCRNCRAVLAAAKSSGLTALPAMELCTSEEAHILCLFADIAAAEAFSNAVYATLPDIANNAAIFGSQYIMDENDNIAAEEKKLLLTASGVGVYDAAALAREYGGVAVPAHIDRSSFSVLSNLGAIDAAMGFSTLELSRNAAVQAVAPLVEGFEQMRVIVNSDAHSLEAIPDAEYYWELPARPGAAEVVELLRSRGKT
jgi:predicted metal-dependent phosphoesterase TrpH